MPAKIQTEQARALAVARHAAKEGDAELARYWLTKADAIYPVTKRQRATIQHALTQHEKKAQP